jgi:histone H1/5
VEMNAAAASQLNRAITHGAEKGTFVLPKGVTPHLVMSSDSSNHQSPSQGPSGKIKLAPKVKSDAAKEVRS